MQGIMRKKSRLPLFLPVAVLLVLVLGLLVGRWRSRPVGRSDGRASNRPPLHEPGTPIAKIPIIPGKLHVSIFSHIIDSPKGPVSCWTYMSEGLLTNGQKELSFTIKRDAAEPEDAFPEGILPLYKTIYDLSLRNQIVDEGGYTKLGDTGPGILRDDFRGILYTPAQKLHGVTANGPYLTGIIVTRGEIDVAMQFGIVRVMALLGREFGFFPTAPWLDRRRAELTRLQLWENTLLAKMPRIRLTHASVRQELKPHATPLGRGATVVLRLRPNAKETLKEAFAKLGTDTPMAFLVDSDVEADSCMVWKAGQQEPAAIAAPGSTGTRLGGNFIVFAPGAAEDAVKGNEDGFSVLLTEATWEKVRAAIQGGRSISVPSVGDGMNFAISWRSEVYENPIDGLSYQAPDGWQTYFGASAGPDHKHAGGSDQSNPVKLAQFVFLQPEQEFSRRVKIEELGNYILSIHKLFSSEFRQDTNNSGLDILLQIEIRPPHEAQPKLAVRPAAAQPRGLNELVHRIEALHPPTVQEGPVRFQVAFQVRGGSGEPLPGPQ